MERMREIMKTPNETPAAAAEKASPSAVPPSINVTVKAPTPPVRLGVFTGLKPKGGMELSFTDWLQRVETYLSEKPDDAESLQKLKSSLRDLAKEQTNDCKSTEDLVKKLKSIYTHLKCVEDQLMDFGMMKPEKTETLEEFLKRLWAAFTKLNEGKNFNEEDMKRKVYHQFMGRVNAIKPLVALELRGTFGVPGVASPDLTEVLKRVKEVDSSTPTASAKVAGVHTGLDMDMDKLAEIVADKLKDRLQVQRRVPFRGNCYKCNKPGHIARNCTLNE
jgi:hypothetical protein